MEEVPDKIYLSEEPFKYGDSEICWNYKPLGSIEYVRKDAFIEKACVKFKKLMYDSLLFQGRLYREEVIDNFVKDFKKYIKEE